MSQVTPAKAQNTDSQTFLTALVTNAAILSLEIIAFVFLKHRLSRIYEPRTYLPPPSKRAVKLPSGWWRWTLAIAAIPTGDVLQKNGMDAYMFLRFLRLLVILFASITVLSCGILLPVDTAGLTEDNFSDKLARLSWGKYVDFQPYATGRYAAHVAVVWLSTFWTCYLIRRELQHYTKMRHEFLISPAHSSLAQARTVLITNIPVEMCNEHELRRWASFVPGGVQNIWIYRDTQDLNKDYTARLKACKKLEKAASKLIRTVVKAKRKQDAASEKQYRKTHKDEIRKNERDGSEDADNDSERLLDLYAPPNKRPRHRTGFLGLFGRKVDTIEWYKDEIARLNTSINEKRGDLYDRGKDAPRPLGSAFIQCNLQMGAHVLAQCISYHAPLAMYDKYVEVSPRDVIWDNIDDGAYETRFRYVTSWLGSVVLIIIWFAPVAFVGTLSNVATLCEKLSWTCWIRDAPTPVPGIIQGILPPLFLAILFAILPWVLKGLAWYENIPRWSLLSMSVYKRYFFFLVVHGFLIVTLSSGFASAASNIAKDPTTTVADLASQLPNASIFFLTWTLTQGLTGAGSALLQVGQLIGHFVRKWLLGRTPRQAYAVTFMMPKAIYPQANFGLVLPRISLLATIGLAYSVISPIINPLATVSFMLFFLSWKFLLTWVFDQPDEAETGGQYFPLAINFLFVGMYIEQTCLAALFFLNVANNLVFIVEGVLMVILMIFTLCAQILLRRSFLRECLSGGLDQEAKC
ncbi:uncharacterized protein PHACADRAFT_92160 [Phanerochaete carnosa HHB-10118-sp]|uniref:CSC1/OSCA1-like 7TM region domain-containing protein n=1 Tax=Phanerochaete carnosa (strain HHB-10118-sp) TaxID=650164 RepID=K5V484_PHACS|nr:uncharacterized protein PHACADRAFT_92160 [Phanerochaete carnosa HHB-10118-sp]EKM57401.1 hypothetical protein PHACADRAFT_92160 [Phanerochaete carnosa HHB-10118-sp]